MHKRKSSQIGETPEEDNPEGNYIILSFPPLKKGGFILPGFKSLVGNTYGELTVIEMLRNYNGTKRTYCKCIGVDGKEYIVRQDALQSGATRYIKGVMKAGKEENIAGNRYGKLTALHPTEKRAANSSVIWQCVCDCGKNVMVSSSNLKRGHTTSCGCKKQSNMEHAISFMLKQRRMSFIPEKTFDDLMNPEKTMHLYFDFYLVDYNTVIEYDGELHYIPSKLFGGEKRLQKIQSYDCLKDMYCKEHNIKIVRLNYKQSKEEIKKIIDNIICP